MTAGLRRREARLSVESALGRGSRFAGRFPAGGTR
jgi:hypothetical protein